MARVEALDEDTVDFRLRAPDPLFVGRLTFGVMPASQLTAAGTDTPLRSPDVFRYAFHSASLPPAGANRGRYRDPLADDLIERAEAAPTEAEQAALFRALQARLLETLPYVPLWYEDPVFVARDDVLGYRVDADGGYDGLSEVAVRPGVGR